MGMHTSFFICNFNMLFVIPVHAGIHAGPNGCLFIGKPFFGTNVDSRVRGNDGQYIDFVVKKDVCSAL